LRTPVPTSPTLCEQPVTPICKHASSRTGEDWCGIVKTIPKKLTFIFQGQTSSPVYDLELVYLLNIERNKSYYLVLGRNLTMDYYLVEVSKDASSWTVGRFMSPESGMGLCKKDSNGFQPEECWRRVSLQRVAGADQMRFEDWGLNWKIVNNSCSSPSTK
jgi:hypothetical protein